MCQDEDMCDVWVMCDLCGQTLQVPPGLGVAAFAAQQGWDWFTGDRPDTFHACPQCRTARAAEVGAALTASRSSP